MLMIFHYIENSEHSLFCRTLERKWTVPSDALSGGRSVAVLNRRNLMNWIMEVVLYFRVSQCIDKFIS